MSDNRGDIRVLVADDHTLLRTALCQLLNAEEDIEAVAHTGTGDDLLELVAEHRPDVVLLDVEMPGSHPQTMSRALLDRFPRLRLIIISMYDGPSLVQELLSLGVRGYLHKSVSSAALVSTIRDSMRDRRRVTVSISQSGFATSVEVPADRPPLSPRELDVLPLVADALSNRQIAVQLGISEGTVKRHLRNIFHKLDAVSRLDAVNKGIALQLIDPPSRPASPVPPARGTGRPTPDPARAAGGGTSTLGRPSFGGGVPTLP